MIIAKPWDTLPNATHINTILNSVIENCEIWSRDTDATIRRSDYRARAIDVTIEKGFTDSLKRLYDFLWTNIYLRHIDNDIRTQRMRANAYFTALNAILTLIAWQESNTTFTSPIDEVRVLAALGDETASALLPALAAIDKIREKSHLTINS